MVELNWNLSILMIDVSTTMIVFYRQLSQIVFDHWLHVVPQWKIWTETNFVYNGDTKLKRVMVDANIYTHTHLYNITVKIYK